MSMMTLDELAPVFLAEKAEKVAGRVRYRNEPAASRYSDARWEYWDVSTRRWKHLGGDALRVQAQPWLEARLQAQKPARHALPVTVEAFIKHLATLLADPVG